MKRRLSLTTVNQIEVKVESGRTEKDLDDLVHSDENEKTTEQNEEDPDDAVHRVQNQDHPK
jgi:hypothetical protein